MARSTHPTHPTNQTRSTNQPNQTPASRPSPTDKKAGSASVARDKPDQPHRVSQVSHVSHVSQAGQIGAVARPGQAGKTRWERLRKDDLSLSQLSDLLATEKAASGKSAPTVTWYRGAIRRYSDWLVEQELEPTLANFTLEHVRAYIVALQQTQARDLHPTQPTENYPIADSSINSYVRALRGFSSWLYEENYTTKTTPPNHHWRGSKRRR
ncbi:MAG TPA: hypothetical protein VHI51_10700 [Ktedonobacterales bacterium]|nr:hypothetical protein [Ktedonobacterales bacterium]